LLISSNSNTITFSSSFIYPWFHRKIIDGLITNFHLPQTSLVMLVAGMIWYNNRKKSYQYAIDHQYRFASFGDAMMINFTS
jgi:S-adenosylmethionine:tRNA ribosyltransferase-isomerase